MARVAIGPARTAASARGAAAPRTAASARNLVGPYSSAQFIADLQAVGQIRALWIPNATDTTMTTSTGPDPRVWTYDATIAARLSALGPLGGQLVTFNGTSQYATTPDTNDLSFGNGTVDSPFSIVALANVTAMATNAAIFSKDTAASPNREYQLQVIGTTNDLQMVLDSQGASTHQALRTTNAGVATGGLHLFVATYSAATGGATAGNDIVLTQDARVIPSTATNDASYVAMSNGAGTGNLGMRGATPGNFFGGSMGFMTIYGNALSLVQQAQVKTAVNNYFGTAL